jgi:hypothetical protein
VIDINHYLMNKLRKLLTFLMMLLLPLQGLAATGARMHMATSAQSAEAMPCHEHLAAHHDSQPAADEGMSNTAHDTDAANHLCCHQVLTCVSVSQLNTPAQKFSDVSRFVLPLFTLFIPDSPDRPPRG